MGIVLAVIPARAGSKRLPGKNKRVFKGMPLWWWSVACAQSCENLDGYIVTTDDKDIYNICFSARIPCILREEFLATDDAPMKWVCVDAVMKWLVANPSHQQQSFSAIQVVLLQPTSPNRDFIQTNSYCHESHGHQVATGLNEEPNGEFYRVSLRHLIESGFSDYKRWLRPTTTTDIDTQEDWEAAVKEKP